MKIELLPFNTPNFVIIKDGCTHPRGDTLSYPLKMVDADELSAMCDAFRAEVFKKAGRQDPRIDEECDTCHRKPSEAWYGVDVTGKFKCGECQLWHWKQS